MKLTIEGEAKEVAAFLLEAGKRPDDNALSEVTKAVSRAAERIKEVSNN